MRYLTILSILLVLASSVFAPPAAAETRYVVDELVITLRLGKSTDHKILKNLKRITNKRKIIKLGVRVLKLNQKILYSSQ